MEAERGGGRGDSGKEKGDGGGDRERKDPLMIIWDGRFVGEKVDLFIYFCLFSSFNLRDMSWITMQTKVLVGYLLSLIRC